MSSCRVSSLALAKMALARLALALLALSTTCRAADDLVGWWRFDSATPRDLSANQNDAVATDATPQRERGTTSLQLDGLDSRVLIAEHHSWALTDAVSALLWVRAAELRNRTVLFGIPHETVAWTTPMFGMYAQDGHAVWGLWLNQGAGKVLVEGPTPLPLDTWLCLVGTYDGAAARLYVNGTLAAEQPARGPLVHNSQPLLVGQGLGNKPALRGRVGELRLWRRGLSAAEVQAVFDRSKVAYDLAGPAPQTDRDGTVPVETHGTAPGEGPWRTHPTRLLALLDGYRPAAIAPQLDRYGGWRDRPAEPATGYFRVQRLGGRTWLIDPDGYRFFHVAINAVREPRNAVATHGSLERWAEATTALLRQNGFNGTGNWSSPLLAKVAQPLVWVLRRDFMFAFAREKKLTEAAAGTTGFINRAMPVFHPDFESFCERYGAELAATANDPALLGIMTDNELQCPVDLLDRYLAADVTNADLKPGHDAAAAWLAARPRAGATPAITQRERYEFIAYAFERYYRIVTRVVRRYDPHHLYLGSRLNYHAGEFDNPYFWKMLAPFHDVVSVNYYSQWGPQPHELAQWEAWAGRPILLTEWYAKAADVPGLSNAHGAGWLVHTQADRASFYQHFVLGALELPNVVGCHWFKYSDDPAESKALDSAGGANKGMFNGEGVPYVPLLTGAAALNREVYPLTAFFDQRRPPDPH